MDYRGRVPGRQPVAQAQTLVVQGLLCGKFFRKSAVYREKRALAYRRKGGQNTGTAFSCLKVRGGSLPSILNAVG